MTLEAAPAFGMSYKMHKKGYLEALGCGGRLGSAARCSRGPPYGAWQAEGCTRCDAGCIQAQPHSIQLLIRLRLLKQQNSSDCPIKHPSGRLAHAQYNARFMCMHPTEQCLET